MLPPPAFAQPAEAEAPAAAQPSDVRVVREEEAEEADDQFDADALSPLPVVAQPPAADELRRLEAEFAARADDGRQASKDTQQRVLGLLSGALGKTKEYKDGRFMLIRGSEPEKGATGMVANPAHPLCDACVSGADLAAPAPGFAWCGDRAVAEENWERGGWDLANAVLRS